MRLPFTYARLRVRPGARYTGPATFTSDRSIAKAPGYYALHPDGRTLVRPLLRLVCVDDNPGDHINGGCHYEIARRADPPQKNGPLVPLEAHSEGNAEVAT